jgi:hypothetical protein
MSGMSIEIIPRAEWGAVKPRRRTPLPPEHLAGVAVHWFGSPVAARSHDECPALLRSVQQGHLSNKKENYSDIAYNHAVCPHGSAYELRGFGVQTGANGFGAANRSHASIVYMAGTGDTFTDEAKQTLAELIREWQKRGAGLDVKPHGFFTGSTCPGPDVLAWLPQKLWALDEKKVPVKDETPDWLLDFVQWRLVDDADPKARPESLPKRIPSSAWETAARVHKIVNLMGPQEPFLDWAEWRNRGGRKTTRPRSLPAEIPKPWWAALKRLRGGAKGKAKPALK